MEAVKWIVVWGLVSLVSAVAAGIIASYKRRDHSAWAAWCFVFPPLLIVVALLHTNQGPRPRRPSLDEDDATSS
ncbi:MAG: hypothetical protein J0I57_07120 [Hyphomicrobium sp.]|uniref:hypothetical protein n=1 Tax=Hyphomicrobium sp. CS1BSMeth3 TaxID=1892844 RepID=UPI000869C5CB|nr:hypothetical protein [Hyphomicrobium sp. CS1BSMeth3]MBN9260024.1 hypothetical protein [Hyphomicrobium sp.]ODT29349.1 MAG: hypothetical protein ABS54_05080 [Hyphomicrobium sp. SCN 65-11]OJU25780.1 MAG: hypothetical protein BGN89_05900 [Alphaproteobacteria bacterium 64-6]MBN9263937.1 hypothetical protein [Hyphomicrobium sp.]MBN9277393.1 hypothetical protein [Hyphomicrobium sp.]